MKQCFAFCAVFPKDYEMEKDMLIQLCMANGFIHEEGSVNLAQKGEFVFKELVLRSFLQDVKATEFVHYRPIVCKMHDLMHDLAKDVTDECASEEDLSQKEASIKDVHHMQLGAFEVREISGLLQGTSSLHTLLTKDVHMDLEKLKLTSLRALSCYGSSIIPRQLKHLRYLDLSHSSIVRLPDSVCMFHNLQTLRLVVCGRLQFLPEGMAAMRKLRHLYLLGCVCLERMPSKLSLLHNLCTLTTFIVDTGDDFGIEELKDFRQFGDRLELFNLRKVKSESKINLHDKHNLSELLLYWGRKRDYDPSHDEVRTNNEEEVLESLVPHDELKILEVHGYGGHEILQWMRDSQMFRCLRELCISHCPRSKDLPIVWLSPVEHLSLSDMNSLTTLCKNIDVEATRDNTPVQIFPKLKIMSLINMPELEMLAENSAGEPSSLLMFPQLEKLTIKDCNKLATLPESPVLTFLSCGDGSEGCTVPMSMSLGSWPSLVHLGIYLLADVVMPLEDHQTHSQRPLETLRRLEIHSDDGFVSMFNLSTLQSGPRGCFAFVEDLYIASCSNIICLSVEQFRCFPHLRSLFIASFGKLEQMGSSSEEILPLPQLESLRIGGCASLLKIPMLPASLEEMTISNNVSFGGTAFKPWKSGQAEVSLCGVLLCNERTA